MSSPHLRTALHGLSRQLGEGGLLDHLVADRRGGDAEHRGGVRDVVHCAGYKSYLRWVIDYCRMHN